MRFRRIDVQKPVPDLWLRQSAASLALAGIVWGLAIGHALIAEPPAPQFVFTIPVLVGVVGGSIISGTVSVYGFLLFSLPVLAPAATVLVLDENPDKKVFGLLVVGFVYFTSKVISDFNRALLQLTRKRHELDHAYSELKDTTSQVKVLEGLLPICVKCKSIRDAYDVWHPLESFIHQRSEADFTHGICPICMSQLYGSTLDEMEEIGPSMEDH